MFRIIFFVFFISLTPVFGQLETANWIIGNGYRLDLTKKENLAINDSKMLTKGSGASISDDNGKLLFYTDGATVWDSQHEILDNGTNIGGLNSGSEHVQIVPIQGEPKYFIINSDSWSFQVAPYSNNGKLSYAVVTYKEETQKYCVSEKDVLLDYRINQDFIVKEGDSIYPYYLITHKMDDKTFKIFGVSSCDISFLKSINFNGSPPTYYNNFFPFYGKSSGFGLLTQDTINGLLGIGFVDFYSFDNQNLTIINLNKRASLDPQNRGLGGMSYNNKYLYFASGNSTISKFELNTDTAVLISNQSVLGFAPDNFIPSLNTTNLSFLPDSDVGLMVITNSNSANATMNFLELEPRKINVVARCPVFPSFLYEPDYVHLFPSFNPNPIITRSCEGEAKQIIPRLNPEITISKIDFGDGAIEHFPKGDTLTHIYATSGSYEINITTEKNCTSQKFSYTTRVDKAITMMIDANYTINNCKDEALQLCFNQDNYSHLHVNNYEEFDVSCLNLIPGYYDITLQNACEVKKFNTSIENEEIIFPNIITPNNDGYNDFFTIKSKEQVALSITNRWGTTIYESNYYKNDWPKEDLSNGTYFYTATLGECSYGGWILVV